MVADVFTEAGSTVMARSASREQLPHMDGMPAGPPAS